MTPDEYMGECRGLVIGLSELLPADDVGFAMHLIDHGEPAEGLTALAWSMDAHVGSIEPSVGQRFRDLIGDLVPVDALPPLLQATTSESSAGHSQIESTVQRADSLLRDVVADGSDPSLPPLLFDRTELPPGFSYPPLFLRMLDRGLTELTPWHILTGESLRSTMRGLASRYPDGRYVPFACRQDNDDFACWVVGGGDEVVVVHDHASVGREQQGRLPDFAVWLRQAVDDFIDFET